MFVSGHVKLSSVHPIRSVPLEKPSTQNVRKQEFKFWIPNSQRLKPAVVTKSSTHGFICLGNTIMKLSHIRASFVLPLSLLLPIPHPPPHRGTSLCPRFTSLQYKLSIKQRSEKSGAFCVPKWCAKQSSFSPESLFSSVGIHGTEPYAEKANWPHTR